MQPAALNVTYFLDDILQLLELSDLRSIFTIEKLDTSIRVFNGLTLIYHARQLVLATALRLSEEPGLLIGRENDDRLSIISKVLENDVAGRLNGTVTHHGTTEFEVNTLEADVLSIGEFNIVRPSKS
jgi:hypothetical protein